MNRSGTVNLSRVAATDEALGLVPAKLARRLGVLPLVVENERLIAVLADSENLTAQMQLETRLGMDVEFFPATEPGSVAAAIERYYGDQEHAGSEYALAALERAVNRALLLRCSDIHFDPEAHRGVVRMRVDGMMRTVSEFTPAFMADLISAVKVAAKLDISEKRIPQDGQMSLESFGETVSLRVALVPTLYGEKATLRILAAAHLTEGIESLESLGFVPEHYQMLQSALDRAHGMILLSGPTGSGKTTTLYAALRYLRQPGTRHIISIENPIEIPLNGITQIPIDEERTSFAKALRSVLRHDPDVVMVGEIRDAESADIAMKSAMTGHLVLATIHANTALAAVPRLLNLGVRPSMISSTVSLLIAQRLVRRPCTRCSEEVPMSGMLQQEFGWTEDGSVPKACGCSFCAQSGYAGRLGLYEMVSMDSNLRNLIHTGASEDQMAQYAFGEKGLPTLHCDGAGKIVQGLTTPEEVRRITFQEAV